MAPGFNGLDPKHKLIKIGVNIYSMREVFLKEAKIYRTT